MAPRRSTSESFKCKICASEFTRSYNLRRHQAVHERNRDYSCNICQKAFRYEGDCKIHERRHDSTPRFFCRRCERCFSTAWSLKRHEKKCPNSPTRQATQSDLFEQVGNRELILEAHKPLQQQSTQPKWDTVPATASETEDNEKVENPDPASCDLINKAANSQLSYSCLDVECLLAGRCRCGCARTTGPNTRNRIKDLSNIHRENSHEDTIKHGLEASKLRDEPENQKNIQAGHLRSRECSTYQPRVLSLLPNAVITRSFKSANPEKRSSLDMAQLWLSGRPVALLNELETALLVLEKIQSGEYSAVANLYSQKVYHRAWHEAARDGLLKALHFLYRECNIDVESAYQNGATALHIAIANGKVECVRFLLELGAQVGARDNHLRTPLHLALKLNLSTVAFELLRHKDINVHVKDHMCDSPLHIASTIRGFNPRLFEALVAKANDLDDPDALGHTILHNAVSHMDMLALNIILDRGANVEARTQRGTTPLHMATYFDKLDNMSTLLNAGANANSVNDRGDTPLHWARSAESTILLLGHSANPHVFNQLGELPRSIYHVPIRVQTTFQ